MGHHRDRTDAALAVRALRANGARPTVIAATRHAPEGGLVLWHERSSPERFLVCRWGRAPGQARPVLHGLEVFRHLLDARDAYERRAAYAVAPDEVERLAALDPARHAARLARTRRALEGVLAEESGAERIAAVRRSLAAIDAAIAAWAAAEPEERS